MRYKFMHALVLLCGVIVFIIDDQLRNGFT